MNEFTEIREAIEALFVGKMDSLVSEIVRFNEEHMIPITDPTRQITRWVRVDPLGGPVDPYDTNARWRFTRRFRILWNNPAGDMDVSQFEEVERALTGCIAAGVNASPPLGLAYVSTVRWTAGEWATFAPRKSNSEDFSEEQEMWVGIGTLEVDFRKLRTEVATWAPA